MAPGIGLVQHPGASAIVKVPAGTIIVVQYLDDIPFLGRDKNEVARVTSQVSDQLPEEGYLITAKSRLDQVERVTWVRKDVNVGARRIVPKATAIADWQPSPAPETRSGRLVWLGRPGNTASPLWAGTRAWEHHRPGMMIVGLQEGLAAAQRGWEPSCTSDAFPTAPEVYVDAVTTPWGPFTGGLRGSGGARIRRYPV